MLPTVLFRRGVLESESEYDSCKNILPTQEYRTSIAPGSLVIGRYSVLPYYRELERELGLRGSHLINSYAEHSFIADMRLWSMGEGPLVGLTPKTWGDWLNLPEGKSFVLKGSTNSRKSLWGSHMFASSREDVPRVAMNLYRDSLIGEQSVLVREYVPLRSFGVDLNGMPITNEWRTFWVVKDGQAHMVSHGYYWSNHPDTLEKASFPEEARALGQKAADRLVRHATFFVLDLAETEEGSWIVIEVNDGQMSGLSCVDPHALYSGIRGLFQEKSLPPVDRCPA